MILFPVRRMTIPVIITNAFIFPVRIENKTIILVRIIRMRFKNRMHIPLRFEIWVTIIPVNNCNALVLIRDIIIL